MMQLTPTNDNLYNVEYLGALTHVGDNATPDFLTSLIAKEPYNLDARIALSSLLQDAGQVEQACQVRYQGAQMAIQVLPDDESLEVNMEAKGNHCFVEIIYLSGFDCYLFGDFELAAAMFETALELDPEDHFSAALPLAYCYVALQEWELLQEHLELLMPSPLDSELIALWSENLQGKTPRQPSPALKKEMTNDQSTIRQRTEHLAVAFPNFFDSLTH